MAKLPTPPAWQQLAKLAPVTVTLAAGTEVSRIFFADSPYPSAWNLFRYFGPTLSRFDHHLPDHLGLGQIQARGIMYLAAGRQAAPTCLAEVFQEKRTIDRYASRPIYAGFVLLRSLTLIDLTGTFVTSMGASTAIHSGPRARAWARQLYLAYPQCEGVLYCSSMYGNAPAMALFERAADAIPQRPIIHRELRDSAMRTMVAMTADEINYVLV